MAAKLVGSAIVWGADGLTFTAGIVSSGNAAHTQSLRTARTADKTEVINDVGEVVGQVFTNGRVVMSISVAPSHATASASAKTSLDGHMIAPGTKVTVVNSGGTVANGDFNCLSATANQTNNGIAIVDLELEKLDAFDITVAVT
jgi:hypothetical protein